jgi:16S rRNA processing protein RimM
MADAAPPIVVGRIRKPHGLKGEVAVFPLTDTPDAVFANGRVLQVIDLAGKALGTVTVDEARIYHRECLLRFAGHADRDAVERYRGRLLAVDRAELPPLAEGEVYQQEMVGWAVRDESGAPLGIVSAVYDLPQGCTIEVQGARREFLLPFRAEYVRHTDREACRLTVRVPAGLLE